MNPRSRSVEDNTEDSLNRILIRRNRESEPQVDFRLEDPVFGLYPIRYSGEKGPTTDPLIQFPKL